MPIGFECELWFNLADHLVNILNEQMNCQRTIVPIGAELPSASLPGVTVRMCFSVESVWIRRSVECVSSRSVYIF